MDIKVSLPKPNNTDGKEIKWFLRQMELSVHHLQKSWELLEQDAKEHPEEFDENWRDNYSLMFRFPKVNLYGREQDKEGFVKVHVDEETEQMQHIEIEIEAL